MANLFLGVDGGQSSTTALIGDASGRVIGFGRGGPCNHVSAPERRAKFMKVMGDCLGEALRQAGADKPEFEGACLGFSGGAEDKEALVRELIAADHLLVTHDALPALVGACGGKPGLITIAGTGSIAFGRNAAGKIGRAGGWGYVYGDEGGAFDIVRQAVRASLRLEEGWGPATTLRARLLSATGAKDANAMMHSFYTDEWPRSRVATMSKLVDEAARDGDEVARMVLEHAAQQLSWLANSVREMLFDEDEPSRVAYIGGVFRSEIVLDLFRASTEVAHPANQFGPPDYGPAAGALIEAYRLAGRGVQLSNVPEFEK
jgi:N-acetylglucosamine kinase-like BadF-type ATPase